MTIHPRRSQSNPAIRRIVTPLVAVAVVLALAPSAMAMGSYREFDPAPSGVGQEDSWFLIGLRGSTTNSLAASHWIDKGEHLTISDVAADGYRVRADMRWTASNGTIYGNSIEDANGANNGQMDLNLNLPENRPVQIRVCRPAISDCTAWWTGLHS